MRGHLQIKALLALLLLLAIPFVLQQSHHELHLPATPTREPLIPTVIPMKGTASGRAELPTIAFTPQPRPVALRNRICAGVARGKISDYPYEMLKFGWYLDWQAHRQPVLPGIRYVPMVRMQHGQLREKVAALERMARGHHGQLWLIGNEPDVAWQDNSTAEEYAQAYHTAYRTIKDADSSAQIAIGGVSQVTPLRLAYLGRVLAAYKQLYETEMPVDVWNIHTFILREERNSWGVGIPPGFDEVQTGKLWDIADHDRLDILQKQLLDMRRWLYNHGRGGIPMIISEYGILMPPEYGFPPERTSSFLQKSFALFQRLKDPVMGDPNDGYRLVQRWCWYSLSDTVYPAGNLFDPTTKTITPIGVAFATYTASP